MLTPEQLGKTTGTALASQVEKRAGIGSMLAKGGRGLWNLVKSRPLASAGVGWLGGAAGLEGASALSQKTPGYKPTEDWSEHWIPGQQANRLAQAQQKGGPLSYLWEAAKRPIQSIFSPQWASNPNESAGNVRSPHQESPFQFLGLDESGRPRFQRGEVTGSKSPWLPQGATSQWGPKAAPLKAKALPKGSGTSASRPHINISPLNYDAADI